MDAIEFIVYMSIANTSLYNIINSLNYSVERLGIFWKSCLKNRFRDRRGL
jgi:hypothetical protein